MRLHSVTLRQKLGKVELADYFYDPILGLPGRFQMGREAIRWYDQPVHLAVHPIEWGEDPQGMEGFTGVQLNVMPASRINELVEAFAEAGQEVGKPRQVEDIRLIQARDSSGNVLMLLGRDERPDEPLIDEGVGSLSIFVSDLAKARALFVTAMGLGVRAEPHEGLLVLGETGTPLMLYATNENSPATPMGRRTGIAFADPDLETAIARIESAGGKVVNRSRAPADDGVDGSLLAATLLDHDGNEFLLFADQFLREQTAHLEADADSPGEDQSDG